jgi:hypothetical protein
MVILVSRGNSAFKNFQQETSRQKCCLYKIPYITDPIRETGVIFATTPPYVGHPTDAPTRARFFLVHKWCVSQETRLVKDLTSTSLFYKEVKSKSSTKKGLLYALEESCKEHFMCLSLDTPLWHDVMSTSLKEPAAKDFVEMKANTIALSKTQGTHQNVIRWEDKAIGQGATRNAGEDYWPWPGRSPMMGSTPIRHD